MIKAIETVYKGYRFRSRLEARWAVFLDALDIKWEYEVEGFQSEQSRYLPDFYLPSLKCYMEIKGKEPTEIETRKIKLFASQSKEPIYVFVGSQFAPFDCSRPPTVVPNPALENIIVGENAFYHRDGSELTLEELDAWNKTPHCIVLDDGTRGSWAIEYSLIDGALNSSGPHIFVECPICQIVEIAHDTEICHPRCLVKYVYQHPIGSKPPNIFLNRDKSPRLIAAYTAARQARFEHGEYP